MPKARLAASCVLALALQVHAADFSVRIIAYPNQLPKGAPVYVVAETQNTSGRALVAVGFSGLEWRISRIDAPHPRDCPPRVYALGVRSCKKEILAKDWCQSKEMDLTCISEPSEWGIQAYVLGEGECNRTDPQGKVLERLQGWKGEVSSEEIRIRVTEPLGIDKRAYEAAHGRPMGEPSRLIEKYPTSTYAAYALYAKLRLSPVIESNLRLAELDMKKKYALWLACPSRLPKEVKGQYYFAATPADMAQAELNSINTVLSHHPDFPFRFVFDYRGGLNYYMLHDFKNARAYLTRCLGDTTPEPYRTEAKIYLDVLDENKL